MKVYAGNEIRNVAVVGHGNSGKTSLVAGALFASGATTRLTRADEGNTLTDFDEEEVQRQITISTALALVEWKKHKLNLLDTPGFNMFINDTKASMVAADAALVMVDGVAGVEVQTEKVWGFAEEFEMPRVLVVNKMRRERADFDRAMESIHESFGRTAVPVQLPLGKEHDFHGVIDLITMKAYKYELDGDGKGAEVEIPAESAHAAQEAHEALVGNGSRGQGRIDGGVFREGDSPARAHD